MRNIGNECKFSFWNIEVSAYYVQGVPKKVSEFLSLNKSENIL